MAATGSTVNPEPPPKAVRLKLVVHMQSNITMWKYTGGADIGMRFLKRVANDKALTEDCWAGALFRTRGVASFVLGEGVWERGRMGFILACC